MAADMFDRDPDFVQPGVYEASHGSSGSTGVKLLQTTILPRTHVSTPPDGVDDSFAPGERQGWSPSGNPRTGLRIVLWPVCSQPSLDLIRSDASDDPISPTGASSNPFGTGTDVR